MPADVATLSSPLRTGPTTRARGLSRPRLRWGENLAAARVQARRGNGNRMTYHWAADQVSFLEPCRCSDIKRLESLPARPAQLKDLRLALCLAAYYGLDRNQVVEVLGLDAAACGLASHELAHLNPAWRSA